VKLPNVEQAIVPRAKIVDYLLSEVQEKGRDKATFFRAFGFSLQGWEELASALLHHAQTHEISRVVPSQHGASYTIEGELDCPDGRRPLLRSVWFIEIGQSIPRLSTAYPLRRVLR